jgi:holliday junction DNA helicase RuvA
MIGRLRGTLAQKQPPQLMIDVAGVGYELEAPMSTFYELPAVGQEVTLVTHLAIKEDAHTLYGFGTDAERSLFRTLLKVSGIGAKTALSVLSGSSADEFARLIHTADISALTRIPGIGKKTAERMIVELKDKLGVSGAHGISLLGRAPGANLDPAAEASIALASLGYKPQEVAALLKKVESPDSSAEELIRKALQAALKR